MPETTPQEKRIHLLQTMRSRIPVVFSVLFWVSAIFMILALYIGFSFGVSEEAGLLALSIGLLLSAFGYLLKWVVLQFLPLWLELKELDVILTPARVKDESPDTYAQKFYQDGYTASIPQIQEIYQ
jgi:hypothetical protein